MNNMILVEIFECKEKLLDDLHDFFLFEDAELLLEVEEGILGEFCYQVNVGLGFIEMVHFYYVVVV